MYYAWLFIETLKTALNTVSIQFYKQSCNLSVFFSPSSSQGWGGRVCSITGVLTVIIPTGATVSLLLGMRQGAGPSLRQGKRVQSILKAVLAGGGCSCLYNQWQSTRACRTLYPGLKNPGLLVVVTWNGTEATGRNPW